MNAFRSTLLAALLLGAASCSDSTGPSGGGGGNTPARMDIAGGDLQQAVVGTELAQPLVVRVLNDKGKPVSGQVVNFVVLTGAGHVFAGTGVTNADGEARERWTLGTVADSQKVEARAVDPATGQALVFATFRAIAQAAAPATVAPLGSGAFNGLPGAALADSVSLVVKDAFGNPVPGTAVLWTVKSGGGSVSPATSTTGADGVAKTRWTLGLALDSTQVLEAAAGLTVKTQFTANGKVPVTAQLVTVSGDLQTGRAGEQLAQPLVVRVQLPGGQPLANVPVTFALPPQYGTVTPVTVVTDAAGNASTRWTLGSQTGTVVLSASIPAPAQAAFSATATSGAPAAVQKVSGEEGVISPSSARQLKVRVVDVFGNASAGTTVTWTPSTGAAAPATSVTDAGGYATTTFTPQASGNVTVQASVAGGASATFNLAASTVTLSIVQPGSSMGTSDGLAVRAYAATTPGDAIVRVGAAVDDRRVALVYGGPTQIWQGGVNLAGLPEGVKTLRVWAVSSTGDSVEATQQVTYVATPGVTLAQPIAGTVARDGMVQIAASCTHCTSIAAYLGSATGTPVATGTHSLSASAAVPDGFSGAVLVQATNSDGFYSYSTSASAAVYAVATQQWTEIASAGSKMLDVDASRVLYVDSAGVMIRPVGGGAATQVDTAHRVDRTFLFPGGAIYVRTPQSSVLDAQLVEWRGGALAELGRPNSVNSLEVAGSWAEWSNGTTLYRRDLSAGTNTVISTTAGNWQNDVTENGDVAFWSIGDYNVYLFRGSAVDTASTGGSLDAQHVYVVTDGANVLYRTSSPNAFGPSSISRWHNGTTTVLTTGIPFELYPHTAYEANGGWSAYIHADGGGIYQVFTIAPDGTTRQATAGSGNALIVALSPNGDLVYTKLGRRYATRSPYTTRTDVGAPLGTMRFRGTQLEALVGRSAFSVSY